MAAPQSLKSNGALYFLIEHLPSYPFSLFIPPGMYYYLLLALEIFRNLVSFEDIRMIEESTLILYSQVVGTGKQARMTACPCSPFCKWSGEINPNANKF